jgi:hypothetical protein
MSVLTQFDDRYTFKLWDAGWYGCHYLLKYGVPRPLEGACFAAGHQPHRQIPP